MARLSAYASSWPQFRKTRLPGGRAVKSPNSKFRTTRKSPRNKGCAAAQRTPPSSADRNSHRGVRCSNSPPRPHAREDYPVDLSAVHLLPPQRRLGVAKAASASWPLSGPTPPPRFPDALMPFPVPATDPASAAIVPNSSSMGLFAYAAGAQLRRHHKFSPAHSLLAGNGADWRLSGSSAKLSLVADGRSEAEETSISHTVKRNAPCLAYDPALLATAPRYGFF